MATGASRSTRETAGVCCGSFATGAAVAPSSDRRNSAYELASHAGAPAPRRAAARTPFRVTLVGASAFLVMALAVITLPKVPGDAAAREWLLALASPAVIRVMQVVNYAGSWQLLVPATLLLLVAFPQARTRWWVWIALMLA